MGPNNQLFTASAAQVISLDDVGPSDASPRAPFRRVDFDCDNDRYAAALIFPVVDYPTWTREALTAGPASKMAAVVRPSGAVELGFVHDSSGWCAQSRWGDVMKTFDPLPDVGSTELFDRDIWQVGPFMRHPSFHFFAAAAGRRDPWPQLRAAIAELQARAERLREQGGCTSTSPLAALHVAARHA